MPTIVVAERSEILARGIAALLESNDCEVVKVCTSERELLPTVTSLQPDLVLCGRGLPSSPEALAELLDAAPNARGIALRERIASADVLKMGEQRIIGFLHVEAGPATYRACIGSVRENCPWIDPKFFSDLLQQSQKSASDLTSRENEVVGFVQRGWRNKQIAHGLGITEGTVKMHLHHIFTKLRLATRTELALSAGRQHPAEAWPHPSRQAMSIEVVSSAGDFPGVAKKPPSTILRAVLPTRIEKRGFGASNGEVRETIRSRSRTRATPRVS